MQKIITDVILDFLYISLILCAAVTVEDQTVIAKEGESVTLNTDVKYRQMIRSCGRLDLKRLP